MILVIEIKMMNFYPINKKVIEKMKNETIPLLVLDSFTPVRSKSFCFSYNGVQTMKQKRIQNSLDCETYINSMFMSETASATKYIVRSNLHNITMEKQNKLALNLFDDKRVYSNPIQCLPWDKHTQQGDCPCLFCLRFTLLCHEKLTENCKTDEENDLNVWYWKQSLTHQEILKQISDRPQLL